MSFIAFTREAIEDAAKDNVKYMELRFTPVALSRPERFPLHDVIDWVISSAKEASEKHGVIVRLIASVNRHESAELAEQVAWLAADHVKDGLVALDLAGNEADFPSQPFYGIFKEAKQAGLHVTIHAGEWGPAYNVSEAIEEIGAERIGHGVRVMEDESIVKLAREGQTAFEVCITSNYQSGIFESLEVGWIALGATAAILLRREDRGHGVRRYLCGRCAYNLTGNVSGVCPECGTAFSSRAGGLPG